jgi:hypothetical protein
VTLRAILLRLRIVRPAWADLTLHERILASAIRGK